MPSSKKEIIYELLKGVIAKIGMVSYGHKRKRLVSKAGISEIALYSAVASHIDENDIKPLSMVNEMITLIDECNLNPFFAKNDDRYHYLRDGFNELLMSNNPPENTKFLCNRCYLILPTSNRSSHTNYKHSCSSCVAEYSKAQSGAMKDPNREKRAYKKREPKVETNQNEPSEISSVLGVSLEPIINLVEEKLIKQDPYINIKNIMADANIATVEMSVKSIDLLKILHLVDGLLIRDDQKEAVSDA